MSPSALQAPDASPTRERILDVAEALFAANGYAGTAVRDIARAVELTPASLYNHFEGKQALYEAVLERGVRPMLELLGNLPADPSDPQIVESMIESIMAHLATHPHLPGLVQQETITGGSALANLARAWIRPLIEQGMISLKGEIGSTWSEDEFPNLMFGWLHLIFGYFSMAPMMREVMGTDPLSEAAVANQTRFLLKLVNVMKAGRVVLEQPETNVGD
jgi:TetR/AcrR family transcriptional regulator